jgi:prepilin-type N-terminal cleavage/methylation domain-containing protein/prepilin-type processing-associated H-X9-DG protein
MIRAFTLVELLVTITILTVVATLLLSSLSRAKEQAQGVQCLSNQRQTTIAWKMYSDDNGGSFPVNAPENEPQDAALDWETGILSWKQDNTDNTNTLNLSSALLGPYVAGQLKIYKCPADVYLCYEGGQPYDRVRSISMNCFVGWNVPGGVDAGIHYYANERQLGQPTPSMLWLFVDEHPDTINDGFLVFDAAPPNFVDVPAAYHDGACGFGFVDGHAEIHKWIEGYYWWQPERDNTNYHRFEDSSGPDTQWMALHSTYFNQNQ